MPHDTDVQSAQAECVLIWGEDSAAAHAAALRWAERGADVALAVPEGHDMSETHSMLSAKGRRCVCFQIDLDDVWSRRLALQGAVEALGRLDFVVTPSGEPHAWNGPASRDPFQLANLFLLDLATV